MTFVDRYCAAMSLGKIRRISAALMAVVLAIGLTTHGVGGPNMITNSAMALTSDMPMSGDMPGKCDGCAGDELGTGVLLRILWHCYAFPRYDGSLRCSGGNPHSDERTDRSRSCRASRSLSSQTNRPELKRIASGDVVLA